MSFKKVTIRDVAKEANVSTATVSRALNMTGPVKQNTLNTIIRAAEKLGYAYKPTIDSTQDASSAKLLQSVPVFPNQKEQNIILVNIPNMSNPFYSKIIDGIHASAESRFLSVVFSSVEINDLNVDSFIQLMKRLKVIGIIILNNIPPTALMHLTSYVPVVQCCEYYDNPYASYVGINDYTSTEIAINYYHSMGREKIGFINGPMEFKYSQNRLAAYKSIMANLGIDIPSSWIIQLPELNHDIAFTSIVQVLSSPNPPDCFFAVSDVLAAAAIKAAQYCNLQVPSDIMVIGFDNTDISQLATPSITTIKQPCYQLGFLACELLFEKIENPASKVKQMKLPTELIIRESTAIEKSAALRAL